MTDLPEYEVYAIKYGDHHRNKSENFIFKDPHDGPMPIDFFIWAIVGGGKTYVVDVGFEHEDAKRRERNLTRLPSEGLQMIDIDPAKVEDLIVTHMHYDHCGDLSNFPNARIHLQEREMVYATGRNMCHGPIRHAFNVDYVVDLVRAVYDDRVNFIDGAQEIAPGISLHHIGGHTDGIQSVRVHTRKGWMVLASDATHFYANIAIPNPFPIVYSVGEMLAGYDTLRELAGGEEDKIIPGHDPQKFNMFPAASKKLEGAVLRLDADPIGDLDEVWLRK